MQERIGRFFNLGGGVVTRQGKSGKTGGRAGHKYAGRVGPAGIACWLQGGDVEIGISSLSGVATTSRSKGTLVRNMEEGNTQHSHC